MFDATFNLLTSVRLPYCLEHWKMAVFKLKVWHQTIISATETSSKMATTLLQKWFQKWVFVKTSKFCIFQSIRFCSNFISLFSKYLSNNVWRYFRLPMSAIAIVAWKSFSCKFSAKTKFPIWDFMLPLLMLTLEVLSLSMHYFIRIWTTCWWNLNKIILSKIYRMLIFLTKMVKHFWHYLWHYLCHHSCHYLCHFWHYLC